MGGSLRLLRRLCERAAWRLDLANVERQRWMVGHAPTLQVGKSGAAVWVNLPGASPEDVDVSVRREGVLVVSGVGACGAFYREVPLPERLALDRVCASMSRETLWVTFRRERGDRPGFSERVAVEQA
ncbi:MAG: Hsp20/alpha crystallin family protein [Rubrobacter sp.]|nr:Hsp20/alpha crystallin family protein [Rubrobacter sp.]